MGQSKPLLWLRSFGVTNAGPEGGEAFPMGMKALGLLAHLAEAAPRPVTRDALVNLLWERVAPAQGKGSLRQEIRRVKKSLGDALFDAAFEVTDNHIGLREGAVGSDIAALEKAASSDDPDVLAEVLSLYSGDFLADNSARAEPFQQWAMERRAYYRDTATSALARLAEMDIQAGRHERAQKAADRLLTIDNLHEQAHEIVIRCHLATGRRGQARAHFERFRAQMLRELGAEPQEGIGALVAEGVANGAPRPKPVRRPDKTRPVVAVLNVSPRTEGPHAYLADGVAEQLVGNLAHSSWLKVASLNNTPLLPPTTEVERVQRDLREFADYILRVDVRAERDRVAITATLNRVADNETIFSDRMEDSVADVLALQRQVALRIASIFEPIMLDEESKREAAIEWDDAVNFDFWRLLMRARWLFWTTKRKNNEEARKLLKKALQIEPSDVPTHCILAFSHLLDGWSDWTDDVEGAVQEARRWAQKAVRIAPNSAHAQFTLGAACATSQTLEQAKSRMKHALRLSPSLVVALGDLGRIHAFSGETKEAVECSDRALDLSPFDPHSGLWIRSKALAYWINEDLKSAHELIDYALIIRPGWFQNHYLRACILAELGKTEEARRALATGAEMIGDYSDEAFRLGHPFMDEALLKRFAKSVNKAGANFTI